MDHSDKNKSKPDGGIDPEELTKLFEKLKLNKFQFCPYCQSAVEYIWVHGHYQCPKCKNVVISCCGES
ncbi:MAG TPA: hypothetical protein PK605_13640 [Ignavibacteria bacterium]|nr:hypothetical protein [Ignavibacteria bacterium]HRE10990.1 hypothetical protein [Ignavibacteria bacterium]HRF65199.1 hypothetical protein [Ignavibacteria bacterium]HRJ05439.1 hypothetical protein [Ignavibacteria bacterium]